VIPSGGGHWAVTGPFTIPAAVALHASIPATTMAVAMGRECQHAPAVLGFASGRDCRYRHPARAGYTVITFVVSTVIYAAALLLLI
jgi:short-chain fatty acids transporter